MLHIHICIYIYEGVLHMCVCVCVCVYVYIYMYIYIYIYIYTSQDPPISIGGDRKRDLNKKVNDRTQGSQIRTRNSIEKFEQEVRT